MKIIIGGAGDVGTHLAKLFAKENHDIVLMDEHAERLQELSSDFDMMPLHVSPNSIKGLKEAGADKADLFIGVTPDESRNITCCMLAHSIGARKTVARIDNYEYLNADYHSFFAKMGIDSLIYPELLAAREIVESIRMSWIRQWWDVHDGELALLGVKLRSNAEILDIPLMDILDRPYHIVAIKRNDETIIPRGSDAVHDGDIVYFMTTKKYVPYIRKIAGKEQYADVRGVTIMGGGRIAVRTAQLLPEYMTLKIIEKNRERCEKLNELISDKVLIINGDGRDVHLLEEEGIKNTEAFIALTDSSETNILACLEAKRMGVRKTVAKVENIDYINMAEKLDIGTIINKKTIAAGHIYQMLINADIENARRLTLANADVAEFLVPEGAKITTKPIKKLNLPSGINLGGLIRDGHGMLIGGDTVIEPGDRVVAFCKEHTMQKLEKFFK